MNWGHHTEEDGDTRKLRCLVGDLRRQVARLERERDDLRDELARLHRPKRWWERRGT